MNAIQKVVLTITATIIVAADAQAGRWLSRDPVQDGAGFVQRDPPPALDFIESNGPSPYIFVRNNSPRFIDPLGLRIYVLAPEVGALDHTRFDDYVLEGFQKIVGDCAKLQKSPIIRQVETGSSFWKSTETRLIGWELYYTDEKPNCVCNSCWKTLKAALGDNLPPKDIFIRRPSGRYGNGIDCFRNAGESGDNVVIYEGIDVTLPEVGPGGSIVWNSAPFDVVLWHEAIGHGYLDLTHPTEASNRQGGSGKDPTIVEENKARNCLRLQGVTINDRAPTYWGWRQP